MMWGGVIILRMSIIPHLITFQRFMFIISKTYFLMVNIGCKKVSRSILVIRESLMSSYLALSELRYWNKRGVIFATSEGRSGKKERLDGARDNLARLHPSINLCNRFHFIIVYIISSFSYQRKYQF